MYVSVCVGSCVCMRVHVRACVCAYCNVVFFFSAFGYISKAHGEGHRSTSFSSFSLIRQSLPMRSSSHSHLSLFHPPRDLDSSRREPNRLSRRLSQLYFQMPGSKSRPPPLHKRTLNYLTTFLSAGVQRS